MDKDKKGQTHRGYFWVYQNSVEKLVFFDYQESRGRKVPLEYWNTSRATCKRTDIALMKLLIKGGYHPDQLHGACTSHVQ